MFYLKLFGGASLERAGAPITGTATQRRRLALLALLATAPSRSMPRDRLATLLFPQSDSERAHRGLTDAVHGLRKSLGRDVILSAGDTLRLNEEMVDSDVAEFHRLIDAGRRQEAVDLYRGAFLDGFFVPEARELEEWVEQVRLRLERSFTQAAEELAAAHSAAGDHRQAVDLWQRLSAIDPYNSRHALSLMNALAAAGDPAGAVRHSRTHAALLREELGLELNDEIRTRVEQLRSTPPSPPPPPQSPETPPSPRSLPSPGPGPAPSEAEAATPAVEAAPDRPLRRGYLWAAAVIATLGVAALATVAVMRGRSDEATEAVQGIPADVYNDFVRARTYMARVNPLYVDSAVELLERVVAREPDFAMGHAHLARAYVTAASTIHADDPSYEEKALLAADRALRLDPDNADVRIARGRMLWTVANGFPHEQSILEYQRALQLAPGHFEALYQLGVVAAHVGLFDDAHRFYDQAAAADPLDPRPRVMKAQALLYAGDPAAALDIMKSSPPRFNPTLVGGQMALALSKLGRHEEAMQTLQPALRTSTDDAGFLTSAEGVLLARTGNRREARQRIARAAARNQMSIQFHHTAYNMGVAYTLMAQPDSAMHWLRRAADEGLPNYALYSNDPDLRPLHGLQPFQDLMSDLKRSTARYVAALHN